MLFRDSIRAQYYLKILMKYKEEIIDEFKRLKLLHHSSIPIEIIFEELILQLADCADQILLPVIAHEINYSKKKKLVSGNTPLERYNSFFIHNGKWTLMARNVLKRYPFLFEKLDMFFCLSINNVKQCLQRFSQDAKEIYSNLLQINSSIKRISILNSDRHRGGKQALLITFESGGKIIYKPTSLIPEKLFGEFVDFLELPSPYNLRYVKVLSKGNNYGWIEFICFTPCNSIQEIIEFYKRAGALLAITDSLNYCDGHLDNLIAFGKFPILLDCETLFHNFSNDTSEKSERSILFTGLVQKPPQEDSLSGFTAAFQTTGKTKIDFFHTHAINERTDNINVRFRGIINEISHNSPFYNGKSYTADEFVKEFVDGFSTVYNLISNNIQKILDYNEWWKILSTTKSRQLIRHTLYYMFLIRKLEQPEGCIDKHAAIDIIKPFLYSDKTYLKTVMDYEILDLLNLDIPYFYHYSENCDLYDGNGNQYIKYFKESVINNLRKRFKNRSIDYMKRSVEILNNVLNTPSIL